ncbi:MAG: hypothetical protein A2Y00_07410 [Omnitrophica WOR_2 bacterium GWF2_43_52]|nr:MAG: hypothetical protein A2Y01_01090 [Omnitrophica WOR_2 bacterium GWC2_44_8]OGX20247.1 MAG: hypothetical protein A2Y00_07410 [Omnitrophica WOR_2 bacterium GWF2_43_52]HAH20733.1 hypothetical protein [Candidatus Omnitrophota bacterium]HBG63601.1 hypothetical protein [Candidatus Omnitrophota bacterium]
MIPLRNVGRFFQKTLRQPWYALSVGLKRAKAYFAYNFSNGTSAYPEAITFFLTRLCNLRCKMCGQWGDSGASKTHEHSALSTRLSLVEIKKVLDEISRFKPHITIFGGEPLMHPEALEIMRSIKAKGLHCLIITNGVMLSNFAENLVNAGIDELNISIDGQRELHDHIRGLAGAFDKIAGGVDSINDFKKKFSKNKPLINLQCTINQYNYERLDELLEVAARFKANSLTFHNLIFLNQGAIERQKKFDGLLGCSSKEWEGFVFEPGIDPQKLYQTLKAVLSQKHPFKVDYFPNFSKESLTAYYDDAYMPENYGRRCVSPWMCAYIFPDGEVKPCLNSSYSFGNIKENDFSEIWNSKKAVEFRRLLKKNKIFPACVRCTELYRY